MSIRSRFLTLSSLFVALSSATAHGSTAPTTPTFVLSWGNNGSAPGQLASPFAVATDPLGNVYVLDSFNHRVQKFDRLGNFILQWGSLGTANGQFWYPSGIAVDAQGNVYVGDTNNNRVQKFTSTGVWLTAWGGSGSGDGQFNSPEGIAVDVSGNVYVVDTSNNRVQKFTSVGSFVAKWGSSGSGNGQFNLPIHIAVGPGGNLFVTDIQNHRVQKFSASGTYLAQWGSFGSGNGQFQYPMGVATDAVGNVYVSEQGNRIQKFSESGTYLTTWGSLGSGDGQFNFPSGLASDAAGNLYVADQVNHRIQKFSAAGAALSMGTPGYLLKWGAQGTGAGQFNRPWDVASGPDGSVYVTDYINARVERFNSVGTFVSQWGVLGSGNGQFNGPTRICVDLLGNIYVADQANHRVQKFAANGSYTLQWGSFGTGNGQFSNPEGMAVDAAGNVYVTDSNNHRIQKFTGTGGYLGQWGSLGSGNGQFNKPTGVAIDAAGNVYVADAINHRIQKFNPSGAYVAQWGSFGSGNGQLLSPEDLAIGPDGNLYVVEFDNHRVQVFTTWGTYLTQWGSSGTLNGQLFQPVGLGFDASGNGYVTEYGNHRVQKFAIPPAIALVSDVRNDQGRQAQIRFLRSSADAPGAGVTVMGYEIYRRNDVLPAPASAGGAASPAKTALAGWTYVMTAPAHGESEYNVVVPTLVDATASSLEYTAFMVRVASSDPFTFYDSGLENGFSIDNIPPQTPAPFTAAYASGATYLHWGESSDVDFSAFRLYRGSSASFVPGPGNLVIATTDTAGVDAGPAGSYYKLSAVDINGNESAFALVGPEQTTSVPAETFAFALEGSRPNPATGGRLRVHFALPGNAPATLDLFDLSGRRVAQKAVGPMGPGRHVVDLSSGGRLRAGIYVVRLTQGTLQRSVRLAVLD